VSKVATSAVCGMSNVRSKKLKFYYAKWTLQIEVVNSKTFIYFCIFRVYLVTGPIKGRKLRHPVKKKNVILMCAIGSCIKVVKQKKLVSY
jgi:hypothetical protein